MKLFEKKDIYKIHNCYLPKNSPKLYWVSTKSKFMHSNWPNTIDWDFKIKKDILKESLKLSKNKCIIDAGAHIGDGIIPIAHALLFYNRSDLLVVGIEPDPIKCRFINKLCALNNLKNVLVINNGLYDKNTILFKRRLPIWYKIINNTGAIIYTDDDNIPLYDKIVNIFLKPIYKTKINCKTLDSLVVKTIKRSIGIIHFDLEGAESKAIKGSIKSIKKYKPYLSIEDFENSKNNIKFLPNFYKCINRINSNDIFKAFLNVKRVKKARTKARTIPTLSNNFGAPLEYKMLSEVDSKKICSKVKKLTKQ